MIKIDDRCKSQLNFPLRCFGAKPTLTATLKNTGLFIPTKCIEN